MASAALWRTLSSLGRADVFHKVRDGLRGSLHGRSFRPPGRKKRARHMGQPGERSAGEDQKTDLRQGQMARRHGRTGGAGKREHVRARWPDPQRVTSLR